MALLGVLLAAFPTIAQSPQHAMINREYAIKAAFLYHFSTYVQWPAETFASDDDPFVIGVFQTDPFGASLEKIAQSKKVGGRGIAVRHIDSAGEVEQSHILFVPRSLTPSQRATLLRAAQGSHVLVVGEEDDFISHGGDVQFYVDGNKVRFAFSAEMTKRQDLKVSSKLLSLAKIVPSR